MPSSGPSTAPASSTTIGWNVNGTGVNGSGTLICAAAAVSTIMNSVAASLSGVEIASDTPTETSTASTKTGARRVT